MTSILTNNSAMAALQTLRDVNNGLSETQNQVSSGLRVGKASDNAAYWSIATTMKSDNKALSAVADALGMGAAKVDTAYTAVQSSIDVVSEIKAKLVAATEDGVDKGKINDEIQQLQKQLTSVSDSASFNGENWVKASLGATNSVVSSFVRTAGGVSVSTSGYTTGAKDVLFQASAGTGGATGILDRTSGVSSKSIASFSISTTSTKGDIDKLISDTEAALKDMTSLGSKLGSLSKGIELQSNFVSKLSASLDTGVGRLVDANMEETSSKLTALKTQQQLAVQALSIANSSSQNILSLFRS
jgi:flagellin